MRVVSPPSIARPLSAGMPVTKEEISRWLDTERTNGYFETDSDATLPVLRVSDRDNNSEGFRLWYRKNYGANPIITHLVSIEDLENQFVPRPLRGLGPVLERHGLLRSEDREGVTRSFRLARCYAQLAGRASKSAPPDLYSPTL